jgi:hypothetical protein
VRHQTPTSPRSARHPDETLGEIVLDDNDSRWDPALPKFVLEVKDLAVDVLLCRMRSVIMCEKHNVPARIALLEPSMHSDGSERTAHD